MLGIPTCCYLKTLKFALPPNTKPKICITPNANPQRESVEYRLRWVSWRWVHVGHVHFMLFVSISFALGSQRKRRFQWNIGLRLSQISPHLSLVLEVCTVVQLRAIGRSTKKQTFVNFQEKDSKDTNSFCDLHHQVFEQIT